MAKYLCDDGNAEIEIDADSPRAAAQEYVDGGDWATSDTTTWIDVWVERADHKGERQQITITVEPDEPECTEREHDWQSPYDIVGGLKDDPGVSGHGAGLIMDECCMHCGCKRVTDTWGQRPDTGEQGLRTVRYEPGYYCEQLFPPVDESDPAEVERLIRRSRRRQRGLL